MSRPAQADLLLFSRLGVEDHLNDSLSPGDPAWAGKTGQLAPIPHVVTMATSLIYLLVVFMSSLLGNLLVLYVLIKHLRWASFTNAFITCLSLSDLLATVLCMPPTVAAVSLGGWAMGNVPCVLVGVLQTVFAIVSTLMVTCVAVNRYCIMGGVPGAASVPRTSYVLLITMACSWGVGVLLAVPYQSLVDKNGVLLSRDTGPFYHCTFVFHTVEVMGRAGGVSTLRRSAFRAFVVIACFVMPMGVMSFCCVKLAKVVRGNATRVRPVSSNVSELWFDTELRTAKTALLMVLLHVVCRGPYVAMALVTLLQGVTLSVAMDTAGMWLFWASCAVNPILYALRSPNFSEVLHLTPRRQSVYMVDTHHVDTTPRRVSTITLAAADHPTSSSITDSMGALPAWGVAASVARHTAPAYLAAADLANGVRFDTFPAFTYFGSPRKGSVFSTTTSSTNTTTL